MNQRNKSLIINIGSEAGEYPHGPLALYAASKAFNDHFSKSMNVYK